MHLWYCFLHKPKPDKKNHMNHENETKPFHYEHASSSEEEEVVEETREET